MTRPVRDGTPNTDEERRYHDLALVGAARDAVSPSNLSAQLYTKLNHDIVSAASTMSNSDADVVT